VGRWQGGARRKKGEDMVEGKKQRLNEICEKRREEKHRNTHRKRGQ